MRIQNMKMKTDNLMSGSGEGLLIVESERSPALILKQRPPRKW